MRVTGGKVQPAGWGGGLGRMWHPGRQGFGERLLRMGLVHLSCGDLGEARPAGGGDEA